MIETYDATLYKSENFHILKYCYDNYASNAYVKPYIEASSVVQETNILQESMEEEIDETITTKKDTSVTFWAERNFFLSYI